MNKLNTILITLLLLLHYQSKTQSRFSHILEIGALGAYNAFDNNKTTTLLLQPASFWSKNNMLKYSLINNNTNYFASISQTNLGIIHSLKLPYPELIKAQNIIVTRDINSVSLEVGKVFKVEKVMFGFKFLTAYLKGKEHLIYKYPVGFDNSPDYAGYSKYRGFGGGTGLDFKYHIGHGFVISTDIKILYYKFNATYYNIDGIERIPPTTSYYLNPLNFSTNISVGYIFKKGN